MNGVFAFHFPFRRRKLARKFPAAGRGIISSPTATDSQGRFFRRQGHPLIGFGTGLIFFAGGLLFVFLGGREVAKSLSFSFGTAEAAGQVIAWHNSKSSKGATLWHPVVRYFVDGREFKLTGKVGGSSQDYALGDAARVLYHPAHPQEAQLNDFSERWFGPLIACGVGSIGAVMGGILTWKSFRDWQRRTSNTMPMVTT